MGRRRLEGAKKVSYPSGRGPVKSRGPVDATEPPFAQYYCLVSLVILSLSKDGYG